MGIESGNEGAGEHGIADGYWLGRQDSNLGMAESKSAALPLGYAPIEEAASNPSLLSSQGAICA